MPKGGNKGGASTTAAGGKSSKKANKQELDDFDAELQSAQAEVAKKAVSKQQQQVAQVAGGKPQITPAQFGAMMSRVVGPGGQIDPQVVSQVLRQAKMIDDKIKAGETAKQREAREKKELELFRQLQAHEMSLKRQNQQEKQMYQQALHAKKLQYENKHVPLPEEDGEWQELCPGKWIRLEQFENDSDMPAITEMFGKSLSEPYTSFTYMHFMFGWKDLCIMLMGAEQKEKPAADVRGSLIGCVVSRVTRNKMNYEPFGYIAMLAVDPSFRGHKLGQKLVLKSVDLMKQKDVMCVQLETPVTNDRALQLYTSLGFVKTKYFVRYYMDGSDAVRLVLFTKPFEMQIIDDEN